MKKAGIDIESILRGKCTKQSHLDELRNTKSLGIITKFCRKCGEKLPKV